MLNEIATLFVESPGLYIGIVAIFGLAIGSFLNVVIYRLPIMLEREWRDQAAEFTSCSETSETQSAKQSPPRMTLSEPRSACPVCGTQITAWQNIPVVSWIFLRGRCATCKAKISARYPVVELATAILSGWVAWHFGFGVSAACALIVTWFLIALTGIDIDHQLLPDSLTLPLMWGGLLAALPGDPLAIASGIPVQLHEAVIGAAAGYLSLWLVFHAFRLLTGKEGMGYGDFKLFAALGAWLGWKMLPLIIILAAGSGAVIGLTMIAMRGRDSAAPMPFGPYLAIAGFIAMLYGSSLVDSYLRVSGLRH